MGKYDGYRTSLRVVDVPRRLLPGEPHPLEPMGVLSRFYWECHDRHIGSREVARLFGVWQNTVRRWWKCQRIPSRAVQRMMLDWFKTLAWQDKQAERSKEP